MQIKEKCFIFRYRDIVPYNWRSVRIPDRSARPGEDQNKYINASWILFKHCKQRYIASQVSNYSILSH